MTTAAEPTKHARLYLLANTYAQDAPERLLLLEAAQMMKTNHDAGYEFFLSNIVSQRTGEGKLNVSWGGFQAQIETVKAREIAWMLLEGAAVAEAEAALMRFMSARVGLAPEKIAMMIQDFREYRKTGLDGTLTGNRTDG